MPWVPRVYRVASPLATLALGKPRTPQPAGGIDEAACSVRRLCGVFTPPSLPSSTAAAGPESPLSGEGVRVGGLA